MKQPIRLPLVSAADPSQITMGLASAPMNRRDALKSALGIGAICGIDLATGKDFSVGAIVSPKELTESEQAAFREEWNRIYYGAPVVFLSTNVIRRIELT